MKSLDDQRISEVAREIISGQLGIVLGSRIMVGLIKWLSREEQKIFLPFIAVESETDDLPLGEARLRWDRDALARKDREVEAYLERAQDSIYEACQEVLARYG